MCLKRSYFTLTIRQEATRARLFQGSWETTMYGLKLCFAALLTDESGISSVEYALLLAFAATGIIVAAEELANAVGNEMLDAASCIETDGAVC